eukprot:scaffold72053_cov63-Phaeocystis_antarctica.AAC.8
MALVSGVHQSGRPLSALLVDARLVLKQQAHHGVLARHRSHYDSGDVPGTAQVDAGTTLQQLLCHAQLPIRHGHVQQPVTVARGKDDILRECSGLSCGRGRSHILQARRSKQHCFRLALHRHLVPTLGRIEASRQAAPPVELGPRFEAVDAHAAAREVGRGGGGGGRRRGGVPPEQLDTGGLASGLGCPQRRAAVGVSLVLEQQAHHGLLAHHCSRYQTCALIVAAQVDAGTALQQLPCHAQVPTTRGHVQQPVAVLV